MPSRTFLCLVLAVLAGCAKPPATPQENQSGTQTQTTTKQAAQVVADETAVVDSKVLESYEHINAYADKTTMRLIYRFEDGREEIETTVLQTRFIKPNRIHMELASEDNRVTVISDQQTMRARIFDPVTKNFDGQTVVVDTPPALTVSDLYKVTELLDPFAPNEMLSALLGAPTGLDMTPLGILLNEGGLVSLLGSYSLEDQGEDIITNDVGETTACEVKIATTPEGEYRLWIAASDGLLRRIIFPPSTNVPAGLSQLELVADFEQVRTNVNDSELALSDSDRPANKQDLQEVSHFVLPPLPPATELLGQEIGELQFAKPSGSTVDILNGQKQVSVVTWFHDHPASRSVIDQLEALRRSVESDQVRLVNVFVKQERDSSLDSLSQWPLASPPVLDTLAMGLNKLKVRQAPTVVVLGANNSVQHFTVGANPNVGANVATVVERLLAGQNVAQETLKQIEDSRSNYQRQLALAKAGDGWVEQTQNALPAATTPRHLKLTEAWKNSDVAEPGNFLGVPGKKKVLLVTDGWNQLVSLNVEGKLVQRISLELPSDAGITLLRAGKDRRDRGLVAAATRGGRRAFIFDFAGKLVMQYPRLPDNKTLINDIAFGDLDADGDPELLVAWQGDYGVHSVGLDGKQRWINRVTSGIVSLGLVRSKDYRSVLVGGELGQLYLVDRDGRTEREISLGRLAIHQATVWPGNARGYEPIVAPSAGFLSEKLATHCGISTSPAGDIAAIGINKQWQGLWEYPLPLGVYRHQIDWPQTIDLPEIGPTWLFPGADGSVHFVSADGKFTDSYFVGEHLRGITGLSHNDRTLLVVATDANVTAFDVSIPNAKGANE